MFPIQSSQLKYDKLNTITLKFRNYFFKHAFRHEPLNKGSAGSFHLLIVFIFLLLYHKDEQGSWERLYLTRKEKYLSSSPDRFTLAVKQVTNCIYIEKLFSHI